MLTIVSDKSDRGEIAFELLTDRYNPRNDLLIIGDKLAQELTKFKDSSLHAFEIEGNKISLNFSQSFPKLLTSICYVTDSDEKESIPSTDVTPRNSLHGHSLSHNSATPHKKGDVQLLINSEPVSYFENAKNSQKASGSQDYNNSKLTNLSPEPSKIFNRSSSGKENLDSRFMYPQSRGERGYQIGSDEDDENDLLSFELKDLGLNETTEQVSLGRGGSGKSYRHQNSRDFRDLTSFENERGNKDNNDYDYGESKSIRSSHVVIVQNQTNRNNNNNKQLLPSSFIKLDDTYMSSRDMSRDISRSISPIRNDRSNNATPRARMKKMGSIQVSDKFEAVIEGIKDNSIENADLTGAGNFYIKLYVIL